MNENGNNKKAKILLKPQFFNANIFSRRVVATAYVFRRRCHATSKHNVVVPT